MTVVFEPLQYVSWKVFDTSSVSIAVLSLFVFIVSGQARGDTVISKQDVSLPAVLFAGSDASCQPKIAVQKDISHCACGPCAIFNAFQFGDAALTNLAWSLPGKTRTDKVRSLIHLYGGKPSMLTRNQPRYLADGGMWDADIAPLINDWLQEDGSAQPVYGERLALRWNETPREQVSRVYAELRHSLQQGFPPVVNLQSYTASRNLVHADWNWLDGHFVTVLAVQDFLARDDAGFSMWVADSESGHVLQVSVSAGQGQPLHAWRVGRNGGKLNGWGEDHPYLTIRSPKLEGILGKDASNHQTICVLQYIVHR
jgi:hypothetical protein